MKRIISLNALLCLLYFSLPQLFAQSSISGYVQNENNEPVPYVNIYLKNQNTGTSTDSKGKYYLRLLPGEYDLVFSSVGYELYELNVIIGDSPLVKNIWLKPSSTELNQIIVKASKKDPAFDIIKKVIDNKKNLQVNSLKSDVYIKAIEVLDEKKRPQKEDIDDDKEIVSLSSDSMDSFGEERIIEQNKLGSTNMVEINLTLNYEYPDNYKEERTGFKSYGNVAGLFLPRFSETDFNIYDNLIHIKGVTEIPVISPISRTSILSYTYKLEDIYREQNVQVYKIKIIPRKKGNATIKGHIYINDSLWNVNRLELEFNKGALKFYDAFRLKENYRPVKNDSLWISYRQEFNYETKQGRFKTFRGNTVIHYTNYQKDHAFPEEFFGNEVAVTTKEAYERDSSYWNSSRPEPLTIEEQEVVAYRDSIYSVTNSREYKDSIEAKYNKITAGDILYDGIGFRSHEKQQKISFSSLLSILDFSVIGGFRFGPYVSFFRRFDSGKLLSTNVGFNIGIKNADLQGQASLFYRYLPFQLGDIMIRGGRQFQSVNRFDAYLNQLKISNYILHDFGFLSHRIELFNGFYLHKSVEYSMRQSLVEYDRTSIINKVIDEDNPLLFQDYEALISNIRISYTPQQKYMREPTYKVVLGSAYPTFNLLHRKGWNGPLSSDIDFDYGELRINQDLILGIFGNSKYSLKLGKFFNKNDLKYVDLKRFRQSDPYLYSDPLNSFQLLDTSLMATDWFFEAHHIHHFNGALINNLPLIKKLRIGTVAGAGVLWIKESNYRHEEIFGGVERVFKLGARRRLRIGLYGVLGESNLAGFKKDWKISFDIIDTWNKNWNY